MQTPKGNEYSLVGDKIFARIGDQLNEFKQYDSIEEVDKAFDEFYSITNCTECSEIIDSDGVCTNRSCRKYMLNVRNESYDGYTKFKIIMTTTPDIPGKKIKEYKRILFSSSSELAGLNRQATRLRKTAESALLGLEEQAVSIGANAIIGITISSNSSQGGSALFGGSSDAIIAIGTAVVIEE